MLATPPDSGYSTLARAESPGAPGRSWRSVAKCPPRGLAMGNRGVSPPEQGQLVNVRQRQYVVTEVAKSTLPASPLRPADNGAEHLVSLSSIEDDALGEELQVIWE